MLKLKRILSNKPSFIYHLGKKTFKIFTPRGKAYKTAELQGNKNALKSLFWDGQVIEVTPYLCFLKMNRGKPVILENWAEAGKLMEAKLRQASTYPLLQAHRAYNFSHLSKLGRYGLDVALLKQAEETLQTLYLPMTSAHGDLHIDNMVYIDREIKIIDWSMFTPKGSFVTDYIHFHNSREVKKHKESWTRTILQKQDYLNILASKYNTEPNYLRLAYAISRIAGETAQREDINLITDKDIEKYNFVLTRIFHDTRETIVQCNNTGVQ